MKSLDDEFNGYSWHGLAELASKERKQTIELSKRISMLEETIETNRGLLRQYQNEYEKGISLVEKTFAKIQCDLDKLDRAKDFEKHHVTECIMTHIDDLMATLKMLKS